MGWLGSEIDRLEKGKRPTKGKRRTAVRATRYEQFGPKGVGQEKPARKELFQEQAQELRKFWGEKKGSCDPSHPTLKEWMQKMRLQTESRGGGDVCSPDREETWKEALAKVSSWKAPGPDGVRGYWFQKCVSA